MIIEKKESIYTGICEQTDWEWAATLSVPSPEFPNCPVDADVLACYGTAVEGLPRDKLKFYKSSETLYTLPENDETGATVGEAVNGEFNAPADGLLVIDVEGAQAGVVDLWASASPDGPGWQTFTGRNGQAVTSKCYDLTLNNTVKYNIRAGKRDTVSRVKVTFDWFVPVWDSLNCGFPHNQRTLDILVMPLPVVLTRDDPVTPQLQKWTKSDSSTDLEMRFPRCPDCSGQVCSHGNITDWFVMWPTQNGKYVREGHAKGWKMDTGVLLNPGPESKRHEFSE